MPLSIVELYPDISSRATWTKESGATFDPAYKTPTEVAKLILEKQETCGPGERILALWGGRHGQAWSNYWAKEEFNGDYSKANEAHPVADPELTELGHRQATEIGNLLRKHLPPSLIPTKLFVTPLIRGIQTSADMWQETISGKRDYETFVATVIKQLREHKILEHCNRRMPYSELRKQFPALSHSEDLETETDQEYEDQKRLGVNETEVEMSLRTASAVRELLSQLQDETCVAFSAHSGSCRGVWHFFDLDDPALSEAETRLLVLKVRTSSE